MKSMGRSFLRGVCLSLVCSLIQGIDENELINNPSFEAYPDSNYWSFSERTGLWSVRRLETLVSSGCVHYSQTISRTGKQSLSIGPCTFQAYSAVFASQYRDLDRSHVEAPLLLSVWSRGQKSRNLKITFDVMYSDQRFLFLEVSPESEHSDTFIRTCFLIPNYGVVRSVMVSLVVDTSLDQSIYVDDVSLKSVGRFDSQCPIYLRSFPVQRHVYANYLKPSSYDSRYGITLATQFTKDRLEIVEQTAAKWKGPVSAALLLYGQPFASELAQIVKRYYGSKVLQSFVTLHVVWEDLLNGRDSQMYPANTLRNIAISHVTTEYVYYVDADMFPAFTENLALEWLLASTEEAKTISRKSECEKCAFITPMFNQAAVKVSNHPRTKEELKKHVQDQSSGIQICPFLSHAVVDYDRWFQSRSTYQIEFVDNMEPYFIVPSTAPLMNDVYAGYGRDKCAYSRDLYADGFEFFVLSEAFLINLLGSSGSANTILSRAGSIPLRLFLNIDLHKHELEYNHIRYPTNHKAKFCNSIPKPMTPKEPDVYQEKTARLSNEIVTDSPHDLKNDTLDISLEYEGDGGLGCNISFVELKFSLIPEILSIGDYPSLQRKDLLIERLMKAYGVHTYVEIPSVAIIGSLRFMLPLMQPEAVISLLPESDVDEHIVNGVFETYRAKGNLTQVLETVISSHPSPKIFSLNMEKLSEAKAEEYALACLKKATDDDVILIDSETGSKSDPFWSLLFSDMCVTHSDWKTYRMHNIALMKSVSLTQHPTETFPKHPHCIESFLPSSRFTTDIVLLSKNRPLQTFAFVESLKKFATGLNKIWILLKTEDAIFDEGYDLVVDCFSSFVPIEIVRESSSSESFGQQFLNIIRSSSAYSVMIAVDEIIWLRPFNLSIVSSLLYHCENEETSLFQLRLGENIRVLGNKDFSSRSRSLTFDEDIVAFYPRRLPYDFGYVLNVDGIVARRRDLIEDFQDFVSTCRSPGCVEQSWIIHRLHRRSRQWHFMYRQSRMVNNMGLSDGRVADRSQAPTEGSYQLAKTLVEDRLKIDVDSFVKANRNHAVTHQTKSVEFLPMEC